jgi:Lar family restriction alleviation protein
MTATRDDIAARGVPELLPCPFCGGEAHMRYDAGAFAECTNDQCDATGPQRLGPVSREDDVREAIAAWNRRAALSDHPAVKALVAEAEARGMERAAGIARDRTPEKHSGMTLQAHVTGRNIEEAILAEAATRRDDARAYRYRDEAATIRKENP